MYLAVRKQGLKESSIYKGDRTTGISTAFPRLRLLRRKLNVNGSVVVLLKCMPRPDFFLRARCRLDDRQASRSSSRIGAAASRVIHPGPRSGCARLRSWSSGCGRPRRPRRPRSWHSSCGMLRQEALTRRLSGLAASTRIAKVLVELVFRLEGRKAIFALRILGGAAKSSGAEVVFRLFAGRLFIV